MIILVLLCKYTVYEIEETVAREIQLRQIAFFAKPLISEHLYWAFILGLLFNVLATRYNPQIGTTFWEM